MLRPPTPVQYHGGQQLSTLLNDSSYQGLNLVNGTTSNLTLQFSITSTSKLKIQGQNLLFSKLVTGGVSNASVGSAARKRWRPATSPVSVKFSKVSNNISVFSNAYNALQTAVFKAQAAAQSLGTNVNFLQTRLSFTENYMTTLSAGASDLTVADVNQESTNLVTLQTRQQLAIQSLSIATQSEQAVLKLFGQVIVLLNHRSDVGGLPGRPLFLSCAADGNIFCGKLFVSTRSCAVAAMLPLRFSRRRRRFSLPKWLRKNEDRGPLIFA